MEQFKLVNYTHAMKDLANENKCSVVTAMQLFLANLATMKEHYKGAPQLNYAELGQQWNQLGSEERNRQKEETRAALTKPSRGGRVE